MNHAARSVARRSSGPVSRRARRRGAARAAVVLAVVVALAGCAVRADTGNGSGGAGDAGEAGDAADAADAAGAVPAASQGSASTPSTAARVDLASFAAIDNATWLGIQAAPEASAGQRVVVHAYVTRTYATTGGGTVQARVTSAQPASEVEGTVTVLRGSPDVLGAAQIGSVLRLHAEVAGAYAGTTGGSARIPELLVAAAEDVGPYDLAADVTVGDVSRGSGRLLVPLTVRNSSDAVLTYRVDLVATSADGTVQQSGARPELAALAPGSTASMDVRLEPASDDAVVTIAAITRALPDAAP